jgi:hypothetical protein
VVPWRQRKIAWKIKIRLCFAFPFLDNVLEGEEGREWNVWPSAEEATVFVQATEP